MEALSRAMTPEPSQHRQELVQRLDFLRANESFCDVTITVKGKEFNAHKVVLAAASPFFLTLLTSDMRESNEQLIRIELEEATAPVMEDVLKYIYTGNVSVTEKRAHNLFATADYLLLPGLKTMVGNFLNETLTIENCIFNYYFAEKYQCVELKEKSCEVINLNFSVVMETEDFLNLNVKQVMEWVSSDHVTVNAEEEVFKGIVKWVSHNKSEREGDFPELLHQVRLTSLSHDYFLNKLMKEELITKNAELRSTFLLNAMKLMLNATDGQPRKCLEKHTDAIFVCGGRKSLCYFPQQNVWYRLADTLFDHNNDCLAQCKSKIYIVGGQASKLGESQVMEFFIPTTNSWGMVPRHMKESSLNCCTVFKGVIYASYLDCLSKKGMYRYDVETNCWDTGDAPPTIQGWPCVVCDDKHLYLIGGQSSEFKTLSITTRFDPSHNKWEQVADINEGRYGAFGAAMNGKVFVAGGKQSWMKPISSCEVYDPSTNEWHFLPSLKVPRFQASMVCFEGRLYVVGGETYTHGYSYLRVLTVEEFDSERSEWEEKSAIPVKSFETAEEEQKQNRFQACSARLYKGVIDNLKPLNC